MGGGLLAALVGPALERISSCVDKEPQWLGPGGSKLQRDRPQLHRLNRPHHQGRMGQEVEISLSLGLFEFWHLAPWRDSGLRV